MLELLDSRRLRFVLTALLRIAASPAAVSGKKLAEAMHCSRRYLEPDLQTLVANRVLESRRGSCGGYLLARSAHRITLLEILHSLAACEPSEADPGICRLQRQVVQKGLEQARKDCEQLLAGITLADWLEEAGKAGILSTRDDAPNFSI